MTINSAAGSGKPANRAMNLQNICGYLFTVGQNLYDLGRQAGVSLFLQIAIPTVLTAAGFGLIVYDFWNRHNKRKERYEPKNGR